HVTFDRLLALADAAEPLVGGGRALGGGGRRRRRGRSRRALRVRRAREHQDGQDGARRPSGQDGTAAYWAHSGHGNINGGRAGSFVIRVAVAHGTRPSVDDG